MSNASLRNRFERGQGVAEVPAAPAPAKELSYDPDVVPPVPAAAAVVSQLPDTLSAPAPAPVPESVVPPAEPAMKRFQYQPRDEQGRTLGGMQVIEYTDEDDLKHKWALKEEQLVRRLREVTRKQKLGITDAPVVSDDKLFNNASELQEKPLSTEEVFELTQKLNDPTTFVEGRDRLLESALGCSPAEFRQRYNEQQQLTLQLLVKDNYNTFERTHADFYPCAENKQVLTDLMLKKGLAPTVANFETALSELRESGLIFEAPTVREVAPVPAPTPAPVAAPVVAPAPVSTEPKPVVPATNDGRIATTESPAATRQPVRVPSGLNNSNASASGPASVRTSLSIADFEKIPADELKRKLKDPVFAKMVNELFAPKRPDQSQ